MEIKIDGTTSLKFYYFVYHRWEYLYCTPTEAQISRLLEVTLSGFCANLVKEPNEQQQPL